MIKKKSNKRSSKKAETKLAKSIIAEECCADPKVGQDIYVRTALYLSHGADDVIGGLAKVTELSKGISAGKSVTYVEVKEHPGHSYNWELLALEQKALKKKFGKKRAHPDPDNDPEMNRWD